MQNGSRVSMWIIATVGVLIIFTLAISSTAGQTPAAPRGQAAAPTPARGQAAAPAAGRIPRMPDGKPNFTGLWQSMTTADWDIQDHIAQAGPYYQLGAIGTIPPGQGIVDGNEIPYKPEALAQKKTNHDNWLTMDPVVKCYMPGIPRANYMPYPFQIVQSQNDLVFAYQFATSNRVISVAKKRDAAVDTWMGTSNGHWEGETLVIDVTGMVDSTWFDRAGNYHSDALHVVERLKYRTPDVIDYEATIDDKNVFTRPWKISFPLYRHLEKNAQLGEFKCVEFTEELLYGHLRKKP
jgi:hypothetical protein